MRIVRPRPASSDQRGTITDILDGTPVECVTILTSGAGAVRGNHYHKKTKQYAYVLKGRFQVFAQSEGREVRSSVVGTGELVITPPMERHAFVALEDSVLIACAHGPRSGRSYEADTYRLDTPLAKGSRR